MLQIKDLSVSFHVPPQKDGNTEVRAVKNISFDISRGEVFALVGESGSGKSVSALSIMRLLPYPTAFHPSGEVIFANDNNPAENLLSKDNKSLYKIRGSRIAMIFQEPMTALNPLHTIEKQISEVITLHNDMPAEKVRARVLELLDMVELDGLKDRLTAYPHELSGGQRQRVMIAMAIANNPDILIADEPTTALDVTVQAQILHLLRDLQKKTGMAILLITHDLTIVRNIADKVAVMQNGEIVEQGAVEQVFANPQHDYTKHLLSSAPGGEPVTTEDKPEIINSPSLKVYFPRKKGFFGKPKSFIKAVDDVAVNLKSGHTLGVVGESGSGKTTLALGLLRLIKSQGEIFFDGNPIHTLQNKDLRELRQEMQFVFQDPFSSLNPRISIRQIIEEGLIAHNLCDDVDERAQRVAEALEDVGLEPSMARRYPHEFSGGQRQRIGIARALILNPRIIALDEPTSALDLSTQAEIIDLLKDLQKNKGLAYLFISHDLRVIKAISHDIIVMKEGKIVEQGSNRQIFDNPQTDYTKRLISAAFEVK